MWAEHHQVYTHSLLGLLFVPALLSALPFTFTPWPVRYGLALGGWALHVALDFVANWPIPVPWPLSDERYSLHPERRWWRGSPSGFRRRLDAAGGGRTVDRETVLTQVVTGTFETS